jgi:hypothetical protein
MTDLIATVGQKVTERWLAGVVLPGLLYVAIAGWALLAGHHHALDPHWLAVRLGDLYRHHRSGTPDVIVATAVGLAAAGLAGTAATTIAEDVVHRLWTIRGPKRLLTRRRTRTRTAWQARDPQPPDRYLPQRAGVIGERFRLIGERIHAQYGLSVTAAWPRIWVLTNADTRTLVSAAHRRYYGDATLTAWGLLYLPWTVQWWPAALVAAAALALGHRRARASSTALATLIEATVDAHTIALAAALGVELPEGRLTPEEGNRINDILGKRA